MCRHFVQTNALKTRHIIKSALSPHKRHGVVAAARYSLDHPVAQRRHLDRHGGGTARCVRWRRGGESSFKEERPLTWTGTARYAATLSVSEARPSCPLRPRPTAHTAPPSVVAGGAGCVRWERAVGMWGRHSRRDCHSPSVVSAMCPPPHATVATLTPLRATMLLGVLLSDRSPCLRCNKIRRARSSAGQFQCLIRTLDGALRHKIRRATPPQRKR